MRTRIKALLTTTMLLVCALVIAGCARTTHEVTFDHNYEESPDAVVVEVKDGDSVEEETVERDGYRFVGWYTSTDATEEWDFATPVENDMTLYAHWESVEDMALVVYDHNYPDAPDPTNEYVEIGENAPALEVSREGYTFFGWFTDKDGENHFDFTQEVTDDLVLYAYWVEEVCYYLGTSANGYQVPRDGGYEFSPVMGMPGFYELTIDFTEDNRDPTYDGHFYKVSRGGWEENEVWGVDNYAFQPAPEKVLEDGQVAGLGSIYIKENTTLTILFDANTKTIYDDYEHVFETPRIYGDFNEVMDRGPNWSIEPDEAFVLDEELEEGVYGGLFKIPAYTGDGEGYSMVVAVSVQFDMDWHVFGVREQYRFDGTEAGMGQVSHLAPEEDTIYEFVHDTSTRETGVEALESGELRVFESPRIYGSFNNWQFRGPDAVKLHDYYGAGVYEGSAVIPEYEGDNEGHALIVATSKRLYDDEWGVRWGIEEQYLFDGSEAAMGLASHLSPDEDTFYTFIYDASDNTTEVIAPEHGDERHVQGPSVYGDFNGWDYYGPDSVFLYDENNDGRYHGVLELPAYTGDDDGYAIVVALTHQFYDDEWGQRWAVGTQYKLDGTEAAMGAVSHLAPEEDTVYVLTYDSDTNVTQVVEVEAGDVMAFDTPRLYGCFNAWALNGPDAYAFEETEEDGVYEAIFYFDAYEGDDDGYMLAVVLSQKFYDDEWGKRFGAEEQYLLDGSEAVMGQVSYFAPEESGLYRFTFDAETNETTIERVD